MFKPLSSDQIGSYSCVCLSAACVPPLWTSWKENCGLVTMGIDGCCWQCEMESS